jgi:ssDNA-binding Zn-finger/Zn-ribbon topoisomerase 1
MQCPSCNTEMGIRAGPHGSFYYCPSQYKKGGEKCSQSTITKIDPSSVDTYYRSQSIQRRQISQSGRSREERASDFYWEGEAMMEDIQFGELG